MGDGCFIEGMRNDSSAQQFNRSICLRRSLDGGSTWEELQDNITERYSANPSAVFDASRNRTLLIFNDAASKVLYSIASHDSGATWTTPAVPLLDTTTNQPIPGVGGPGNSVVVLPDGTLLAAVYHTNRTNPDRSVSFSNASVVRSSDGGATWGQVHLLPHLGEPSLTVLPSDVKGVGACVVAERSITHFVLSIFVTTTALRFGGVSCVKLHFFFLFFFFFCLFFFFRACVAPLRVLPLHQAPSLS